MTIKEQRTLKLNFYTKHKYSFEYLYHNISNFKLFNTEGNILYFNKLKFKYSNSFNVPIENAYYGTVVKTKLTFNNLFVLILCYIDKRIFLQKLCINSPLLVNIRTIPQFPANKSLHYYLKLLKIKKII